MSRYEEACKAIEDAGGKIYAWEADCCWFVFDTYGGREIVIETMKDKFVVWPGGNNAAGHILYVSRKDNPNA